MHGLSTGCDAPLEVRRGGISGRGVFATGHISKGDWLCEYKGSVYPRAEMERHIEEYNNNNEGCYVVTSYHPVGGKTRLCWDATRYFHQYGRYLNHALHPNAILTCPLFVRGKWRIGFLAAKKINPGDEVVFDYGIRGEEWGKSRLVDGVVMAPTSSGTDTKVEA